MAKNKSTPREIIHDIALKVTNACEAGEVLENPSISPEDIDMLLEKFYCGNVINKVIRNPNSTGKTLIKAAGNNGDDILRILRTGKVKLVEAEKLE